MYNTLEVFPFEIWEHIVSKVDNLYDLNRLSIVSSDLRTATNRQWAALQTNLGSHNSIMESKKLLSELEYKKAFSLTNEVERDEKLRDLVKKGAPLSIVILDDCIRHKVPEDIIEQILKIKNPTDVTLSEALKNSASLKIINLLLKRTIAIPYSTLALAKSKIVKHNPETKMIYGLIKKSYQQQHPKIPLKLKVKNFCMQELNRFHHKGLD